MSEYPPSPSNGILLAISDPVVQPARTAESNQELLLRFKLSNLTGRIRQLTVIADASDARGSFVASVSHSLTVKRHAQAEAALLLAAAPDGSILLSVRESGGTLLTCQHPVLPNIHKEE